MVDLWMMIGVLMMLIVFALLLYFQQSGENFLRPQLEEVPVLTGILLRGRK